MIRIFNKICQGTRVLSIFLSYSATPMDLFLLYSYRILLLRSTCFIYFRYFDTKEA